MLGNSPHINISWWIWRFSSYYEKIIATGEVKCIDEEIPFEIANGWEWCRFSSIYWQLTDGTHSTPKYTQSGIPFLSVKDMSTGKLSFSNTKFISEEEHKLLSQRCHPCKGDLLISKVGTTGIPLIIDDDREFSIFVSLALVKFFPKLIDSSFLIVLLNSPLVQMQVKDNTRGVGNKNWVLTAISNTLLAIPPLYEQKRIVEKIAILSPYSERYEHSERKLSQLNREIVSNLRKSVLQEAIQGRLMPQNPDDEPASVLLQRIRDEKKRLVKEGKLKKKDVVDSTIFRGDDNKYYEQIGKIVTDITDEIPFDIPDSWVWCRMGAIGTWGAGSTPSKGNPDYYGGNILWLRTGELNNDVVYDTEIKITDKALSECSLRLNKIGDVMIAMYGATIGKVAIAGTEMTTNQACCACTPIGVFNWYLFYFLMGSQQDFIKKGEGGAQPNISREKLISHLIPIPPIAEQKRIVKTIEKILNEIKG